MGDVVYINIFERRKLAEVEGEWLRLMDRAAEFESQGKPQLTKTMLDKAKRVREEVDRLRKRLTPSGM